MARVTRSRTTATRRTASTSATRATTSATTARAGVAQPPVPSGAIGRAPKATINGLKGMTTRFDTFATTRGSDTSFSPTTSGSGAVGRGYIKCESLPIQGGCRLNVESFHASHDDKMTLVLMAEVLDVKTNQLRTVNLSVLANNKNVNGKSYRATSKFDISYAEVNQYLQKFNKDLRITPGTTNLSVMAFWNGSGGSVQHRAGGPARGGLFRLPAPLGGANSLTTRINASAGVSGEDTPLPLDMQVSYPDRLTRSLPALKQGGNILSRLESEYKGTTDAATMKKAVAEMYGIVEKLQGGDRSQVDALLGKDWNISTVNRYWLKDDGSNDEGKAGKGLFAGFRVDTAGLPIQDPMRDTYMDDARLGMTHHAGAIRLRKNKQATVINVKPGEGRLDDKTGIRQRIEVGIELKPEATGEDAAEVLRALADDGDEWNDTVFNHAEKQVHVLDDGLHLADAVDPWLDVTQDRHKFMIKNEKTGVEIEFSFDFVKCKTLRPEHTDKNGDPLEVEFAVLEGELDHLQLNSTNQGATADGAGTGSFSTDGTQESWLKSTSSEVTLDIDPRLHELADLENKAFRATGSYKAFEGVNKKLLAAVFPNGLNEGHQKAAHAATLLGLVPPTKEVIGNKLKFFTEDAGIKWTPELDKLVDVIALDPVIIEKMDRLLYDATPDIDGDSPDIVQALRAIGGVLTPTLEYDPPTLEKKIEGLLAPWGLKVSPEVKSALAQLRVADLRPGELDEMFDDLKNAALDTIFEPLADKLGLAHVPEPTVDLKLMREEIEGALQDAMIDPSFAAKVIKAYELEHKGGWTLSDVYYNVEELAGRYPASALSDIGLDDVPIDKAAFRDAVSAGLRKQGVNWNGSVERLVNKVAKDYDFSEAKDFIDEVGSDFEYAITRAAEDLGVSGPKLAYDMKRFDADFQSQLAGDYVAYGPNGPELKTLTHELLEHGAPLSEVKRFISGVGNGGDPASVMQNLGLTAPRGVAVPAKKRDPALADGDLAQAAGDGYLKYDAATQKALHTLIDKGMEPSSLMDALREAYGYASLTEAIEDYTAPIPDGVAMPKMKLDTDAAIAAFEMNQGDTLEPKVRVYLEKALPKAFGADGFSLHDFINDSKTMAKKLDMVEKATDIDRPSLR